MPPKNYMDIMVRCPIPGQEDQAAMALSDFMETEVGQRVGSQALETANLLEKTGMDPDKAILQAFVGAVITNPAGEIVRAPDTTVASELTDTQPSKFKKNNPKN